MTYVDPDSLTSKFQWALRKNNPILQQNAVSVVEFVRCESVLPRYPTVLLT